MEFTGERYIPDNENIDQEIGIEHLNRYHSIVPFVEGKNVLDAACGTGYGSEILSRHASSVIGIDIDKESIEYAKEFYSAKNIEYLAGDVEKIPLDSVKIDVAVSFETLEHLSEKKQEKFLRELKRVLKNDGLLIISTPDKQHYSDDFTYANKYHEKEFRNNEFTNFLHSQFKYVKIYYQFFEVCNLLAHNGSQSLDFLRKKYADASEGKYMVAVCSDIERDNIDISSLQIYTGEYGRRIARILQLQSEVEERNQWALNLDEEIANLRSRVNHLQDTLEQTQQSGAKAVEDLQQELAERSTALADRSAALQQQSEESEALRQQIATLQDTLEQTQQSGAKAVEDLQQELAERSTALADRSAALQQQSEESEALRQQIATLQDTLEQTQQSGAKAVEDLQQELAERSTVLADRSAALQQQSEESEALRQQIATLQDTLEQTQQSGAKAVEDLQQELAERSTVLADRSAALQQQSEESEALRQQIATLQDTLEQTQQSGAKAVEDLQQELAERSTVLADRSAALQQQSEESEALRQQIATLQDTLEQTQQSGAKAVEDLQQELAERSTALADRSAALQQQSEESEALRQQIATLQDTLEQTQQSGAKAVEDLQQELAERSTALADRSAALQQQSEESEALRKQIATLQDTLEQTQQSGAKAVEDLQQELAERSTALADRSAALQQQSEESEALRQQIAFAAEREGNLQATTDQQQLMIEQQNTRIEKMNRILKKVSKKSEQKGLLATNVEAFHHLKRKYKEQLYADLFSLKGLREVLKIDKTLKSIKLKEKQLDALFDRLPRRFIEHFDSGKYLQANPDVALAVDKGDFENALEHFVFFGYSEISGGTRKIFENCGYFDDSSYLEANDDVLSAIKNGEFASAFDHFLMFGCFEILSSQRQARSDDVKFKDRLILFDPEDVLLSQSMALTVPSFTKPTVSIVIPAYNQANYTYACIESIISNTLATPYEIIVADDKSSDQDARDIKHLVHNITFVESDENLGFLKNCNNAAKKARGKYILFLNNDTNVQPGWLGSLVSLIESDETIGMVGSKLVYPDGKLQEAGGIIWNDASGWNFGRLDDPEKPEYNYVKEVDYISGAAIMIRSKLWETIGGFDERYTPAYFEDSDLAFEVRKCGFKVMYQPKSVVVHFEGVSHGTDLGSGIKSYQVANKEKFILKWQRDLEDQFVNGKDALLARDRSKNKNHILVVDHYVPHYDKDAGSRTMWQYLLMLQELGFKITFVGDNFYKHEPYTSILENAGIEILYGPYFYHNFRDWLEQNGHYFDFVYLLRPHISIKYIDDVKHFTSAKIFYNGTDFHFLRMQREHALSKDENLLPAIKEMEAQEIYLFEQADCVLTISDFEKSYFQDRFPDWDIKVIPTFIYKETFPLSLNDNFDDREGILFVGGFSHAPNLAGVKWFLAEIWPNIISKMPSLKFYIVGSNMPEEVLLLQNSQVIPKGFVEDHELEALYNSVKTVVAPLTFGAGVKGKIIESICQGVPTVTTSIGAEGIIDGESVLAIRDDAQGFAEAVVSLCSDSVKWYENRKKAILFAETYFSYDAAKDLVSSVFNRG